MREFKRHHLALIALSLCAVLLTVFFSIYPINFEGVSNTDKNVQDKAALLRLIENSSEIHRLWTEGEDSREWSLEKAQCLKHFGISSAFDESLMRCNPMMIECHALFGNKLSFHLVKPNTATQKWYRYITKSNTAHIGLDESGYLFKIEDNLSGKTLDLFLKDNCQEAYLQNRAYAYGEEIQGKDVEDFRFDNFNQNIYFDRHLVTNFEVNEWIDFGNPEFTKGLNKKSGNDLFLPATHLIFSQMENFCSFKGKQVMLAHFYDAATFLPMDMNDLLPQKNSRSPYFWTKKKSEFREDCSLIFAKECLTKKAYQLNAVSPSWAGMHDSMGGVFEVMRNPIDPESNLKASSFYFPFKSEWHRLGFRANWDGDDFSLQHFDFKGINPDASIEKFQVGFRCMRESK